MFGYALVRLGADTLQFYEYYFMITGGAGIMGALTPTRRLLLGAEPAIDFSVPDGLALMRVRVFVGVRF